MNETPIVTFYEEQVKRLREAFALGHITKKVFEEGMRLQLRVKQWGVTEK